MLSAGAGGGAAAHCGPRTAAHSTSSGLSGPRTQPGIDTIGAQTGDSGTAPPSWSREPIPYDKSLCARTHTRTDTQTHTHACMHTHRHTHAHTCAHAHTHTCTRMRTHTETHKHTCTHAHTRAQTHRHTHACMHTGTHARAHMHTCTRMHTCTQTHKHTCTHTHTHAQTHTRMHAHTETHMCTHMYTHAHTRTRTCTHTRAHTHACTRVHTCTRTHARAHTVSAPCHWVMSAPPSSLSSDERSEAGTHLGVNDTRVWGPRPALSRASDPLKGTSEQHPRTQAVKGFEPGAPVSALDGSCVHPQGCVQPRAGSHPQGAPVDSHTHREYVHFRATAAPSLPTR